VQVLVEEGIVSRAETQGRWGKKSTVALFSAPPRLCASRFGSGRRPGRVYQRSSFDFAQDGVCGSRGIRSWETKPRSGAGTLHGDPGRAGTLALRRETKPSRLLRQVVCTAHPTINRAKQSQTWEWREGLRSSNRGVGEITRNKAKRGRGRASGQEPPLWAGPLHHIAKRAKQSQRLGVGWTLSSV
jgi:hypothetical protein